MQETVLLSDTRYPLRVEYSKGAMEQLRQLARDGLMAAPRLGMGVGGLLLGARESTRIKLLDSIEIPCSHSAGPSFNLTPDEKQESRKLIAEARALTISGKVDVIGWYCSKTRGDAILSESDLAFFAELFPGTEHLALVLLPNIAEPMRAAFFFRDKSGTVLKGIECEVDEWLAPLNGGLTGAIVTAEQPTARQAPIEIPPTPKVAPVPKQEHVEAPIPLAKPIKPILVETTLADVINLSDPGPFKSGIPVRPAAVPPKRQGVFDAPDFVTLQRPRASKLRIGVLSAIGLIGAGGAAYLTQDLWIPRPPLTLTSTELDGSLVIHWDPAALRGIDHGTMFVNDGGQAIPDAMPLDRFQLNSGLLTYKPKSKRVTAKLDAGEASAVIAWFAPVPPPAPTPAPAPAADNPGNVDSPAAQQAPPKPVTGSLKKGAKARK